MKTTSASDLSEVIKAIRKRVCLSMADFAELLGVSQGQVSRYESVQTRPGVIVLVRLLDLAEGVERNPILERLSVLLEMEGRPITVEEALQELARAGFPNKPLWAALPATWAPENLSPWFLHNAPRLAELLIVVDQICSRKREVDPSLARFLRLWLSNEDMDAGVRQCFNDAVRYLEFLLSTRAQPESPVRSTAGDATPDASPRSSYRVTLPIEVGDGVVHQPGEVIDLDLPTAKLYAHALLSIEPARRSKKKSA